LDPLPPALPLQNLGTKHRVEAAGGFFHDPRVFSPPRGGGSPEVSIRRSSLPASRWHAAGVAQGRCMHSRSLPRHSLKLDNITKKNICIATGFAPLISSAIDRSHGMHSLDDMRRREARAPIRPVPAAALAAAYAACRCLDPPGRPRSPRARGRLFRRRPSCRGNYVATLNAKLL